MRSWSSRAQWSFNRSKRKARITNLLSLALARDEDFGGIVRGLSDFLLRLRYSLFQLFPHATGNHAAPSSSAVGWPTTAESEVLSAEEVRNAG
jgi:hypothetical protein